MSEGRTITYKEIKRGGMQCTLEQESPSKIFVRIKYKDQIREYGPFSDEDEASMVLGDKAEEWISELREFGRKKPLGG